jgi:hypothetical protein
MKEIEYVVRLRGDPKKPWNYLTKVPTPFENDTMLDGKGKIAERHVSRPNAGLAMRMSKEDADDWVRKVCFSHPWIEVERAPVTDFKAAELVDDPLEELAAG